MGQGIRRRNRADAAAGRAQSPSHSSPCRFSTEPRAGSHTPAARPAAAKSAATAVGSAPQGGPPSRPWHQKSPSNQPWGCSTREMEWWGTSGACAQVAGLAALLLSVDPSLLTTDARAVIAGGVNSPVRAFASVGGEPVFFKRASGSRFEAEDGREFIDYVGSWGPMILGHAHPVVIEAVSEAIRKGLSFGAPTEIETRMADRVCDLMPSIELVRMVSSFLGVSDRDSARGSRPGIARDGGTCARIAGNSACGRRL